MRRHNYWICGLVKFVIWTNFNLIYVQYDDDGNTTVFCTKLSSSTILHNDNSKTSSQTLSQMQDGFNDHMKFFELLMETQTAEDEYIAKVHIENLGMRALEVKVLVALNKRLSQVHIYPSFMHLNADNLSGEQSRPDSS